MNKLLTVLTLALVLSLGHLLMGCTHSKNTRVLYSAPNILDHSSVFILNMSDASAEEVCSWER